MIHSKESLILSDGPYFGDILPLRGLGHRAFSHNRKLLVRVESGSAYDRKPHALFRKKNVGPITSSLRLYKASGGEHDSAHHFILACQYEIK